MAKAVRGSKGDIKPPEPEAEVEPEVQPLVVVPPALGLQETIVVIDRVQFEKLIVNLIHGYTTHYSANALRTYVMQMFGLKTREEALVLMRELQVSNAGRKANAG